MEVVESKSYEEEELHQHPLHLVSNQEELSKIRKWWWRTTRCSRCSDYIFTPCFRCEECDFFLHKVCAYPVPLELNHPFHLNHPLLLSKLPDDERRCLICRFPCLTCDAYQCSCGLTFHITCAIFTFNIAQNNNFKHFDEHVVLEDDPSIPESPKPCLLCWEPLESSTYFSCSVKLNGVHKKCCEKPHKLNHACHRKHPLLLQFNTPNLSCKICQQNNPRRFVYACSPCEFAIHIDCVSPSPTIEHETHPHPFNLLLRQVSFICDACGTEGGHLAYTCGSCNILVHKECTSLPRFIKSKWHDHRVSHTYSLHREYFTTLDCIICNDEVDTDYGNYCCKFCNVIFHTNCALKDEDSYEIVSDDEESLDESIKSFTVLERNDAGEATVIEHCKHIGHHLMLSDRAREYDDKCCDGCLLPMSASFYHCSVSKCDFFLHKVCAEFPQEKQVWYHGCQQALLLTSNEFFKCEKCGCDTNAFGYECKVCCLYACLRCIIALTPGAQRHPGHEHRLFYYPKEVGRCNACGEDDIEGLFRCKKCDFRLDHKCFSLPVTARHRWDEHRLSLTYHDDNSYSESHFCDICEERRDPNPWFYCCATCDTCVHVKCVINRELSFMKIGTSFVVDNHPHPLTFVKKMYDYPDCNRCGKPCVDFAGECKRSGCNYIVHAGCPR